MNKDKQLSIALEKFKKRYPNVTSGDLQTYILAWNDAIKYLIPPIPKKCPNCSSKNIKEQKNYFCEDCEK